MILDALPDSLRPAAKAVMAALVPLLGLVITGLVTGHWDTAAIAGGLTAVVSALLVYSTPNEPAPVDKYPNGFEPPAND